MTIRYQCGSSGWASSMTLPRAWVSRPRERKSHAIVGIIISSSRRDDFRWPGGSHSVAAPMVPRGSPLRSRRGR